MRSVESRVWLAGSGRSGTTWLGLLLSVPRGTALLYEPLHSWYAKFPPDLTPPISIFDAGERPYFRPDANIPSWQAYIEHILDGGFTRRTLFAGRRAHKRPHALWCALTGRRLVVKEIRTNLMLGWLARNFDLPIVLIVRHPCATVASQLHRKWGTKRNVIEVLLGQVELVQDHLQNDLARLTNDVLDTPVKQLAARWALENRIALETATHDDRILTVAYEDLVMEPRAELARIFRFLGWQITELDWRRVMASTGKGLSHVLPPAEWLDRWQSRLSAQEIDDILAVVHSLGIDLYDEGKLPTRPLVTR